MPRYYFPATDGTRNVADDGGMMLSSPDAARREAKAIATELVASDDDQDAVAWSGWRILVVDDSGDLISEVSVTDMARAA